MVTEFSTAVRVFAVELNWPTKFNEWFLLQIGPDISIYIHLLDKVIFIVLTIYDIISHLICIFYSFFKLRDPHR